MNKKNNTSAYTVAIVSRTRMRLKGTRILYIFAVIPGHVLLCQTGRMHSTLLLRTLIMRIPVDFVVKNFLGADSLHRATDLRCLWRRMRIGTIEFLTCKKCISLENAIRQRNFTAQIISVSISSIVMPVQVGNGPICSKTRV